MSLPWKEMNCAKISSKHDPTVHTKDRLHKKCIVSLPKFPLDLPQINMYFTSLAPIKIIKQMNFSAEEDRHALSTDGPYHMS